MLLVMGAIVLYRLWNTHCRFQTFYIISGVVNQWYRINVSSMVITYVLWNVICTYLIVNTNSKRRVTGAISLHGLVLLTITFQGYNNLYPFLIIGTCLVHGCVS